MNTIVAERLLVLLKNHFFSRTDRAAVAKSDGDPMPIIADDDANLDALLRTHLLGKAAPKTTAYHITKKTRGATRGWYRVGAYTPTEDGLTKWLCVDVDGPGHAHAVADPSAAAVQISERFAHYDLPVYLERSGGGKGWHIWLFFQELLPAAKARELALAIVPRNIPLAHGGFAEPENQKGTEIFPKQDKAKADGGYGNLLWLPWWSGTRDGGNHFYRLEDMSLVPYIPEEFTAVDLAAVEKAISRAGADAIVAMYDSLQVPDGACTLPPDWEEWRKQALAALPLETIYGPWLTGNSTGPGWLECRDPNSVSGDRNPSAGVSDGTNGFERGTFHSFIEGKTVSVFDFMMRQGLAVDFKHALRRVAELSGKFGVPMPKSDGGAGGGPSLANRETTPAAQGSMQPAIQVNNRQLRDIVHDAWESIFRANRGPDLFTRDGSLVRLGRNADGVCIEDMGENAVYAYITGTANWVKYTQESVKDAYPPREVAKSILVRPHWRLPKIEGVLTSPVFGKSGALLSKPGYYPDDKMWYEPPDGLDVPEAPTNPTPEDIAAAKSVLLDDLVGDFPFVSDSDRAHWLAALILPFVRRMIEGPTPLHIVEAPCNGAGKSLLCDVVAIVATGDTSNSQTLPLHDDEAAKTITAELLKGKSIILLDNQNEKFKLNSPPLASVLTAQHWSGRMLGQSKMLTLPNRAVWLMTGNNPNMTTEMARRCLRIRIDPRRDRAWQRNPNQFRHPKLKLWVLENRGRIIHAIHVLVRAWMAAGSPDGQKSMGSFEEWSGVIGGILEVAGVPGLLGCLDEMYRLSDPETEDWHEFVTAWWDEFADSLRRVNELNMLCERENLLNGLRGDKNGRSQEVKLAIRLNRMRDRVFGNKRIVVLENAAYSKGGRVYRLMAEDGGPLKCSAGFTNTGRERYVPVKPKQEELFEGKDPQGSKDTPPSPAPSKDDEEAPQRDLQTLKKDTGPQAASQAGTGGYPESPSECGSNLSLSPPMRARDNINITSYNPIVAREKNSIQAGGETSAGPPSCSGDLAPNSVAQREAWEDPHYAEPSAADGSRILDPWDPAYDPANDPYCNAGDDEDGLS